MRFRTTHQNMLDSCLLRLFFSLVLLQLTDLLSAIPQLPRPPLSSETFPYNTTAPKEFSKRSPEKPVVFEKGNRTKEERILNTSNAGGISFGQYSEQDIIFPDSFEVIFEPVPRIDGPPKCADGTTFCEKFDSYPYLHLRDILQRRRVADKEFFFGQDEVPVELEKRIGLDEEAFLCNSVSRIVFPKIGKNKNNEWKYIVNQGKEEEYVQGVRIETCRSPGKPCNIIGELPQGYRTSCKQKYVYRRLISLNEDGTFIPDTFQLPSSCCCSYDVENFLARSAIAKG